MNSLSQVNLISFVHIFINTGQMYCRGGVSFEQTNLYIPIIYQSSGQLFLETGLTFKSKFDHFVHVYINTGQIYSQNSFL